MKDEQPRTKPNQPNNNSNNENPRNKQKANCQEWVREQGEKPSIPFEDTQEQGVFQMRLGQWACQGRIWKGVMSV